MTPGRIQRGAFTAGFVIGGVLLAVSAALTLWRGPAPGAPSHPLAPLLAASSLYLVGHLIRAGRLAVMLSDDRLSLRAIVQAHLFGAGASALIPFKLGEAIRILEVGRLVDSIPRALIVVWLERIFDLAALALLLGFGLVAFPGLASAFLAEIFVVMLVVIGTVLLVAVVPDNLEGLSLFIIRRYRSARSVALLRWLHGLKLLLAQAPQLIRRRQLVIGVLTLAIWAAEVGALSLFLPELLRGVRAFLVAVALVFGSLFGNDGALAALADGLAVPSSALVSTLAAYHLYFFTPLGALALGTFLWTAPRRLRSGPSTRRTA